MPSKPPRRASAATAAGGKPTAGDDTRRALDALRRLVRALSASAHGTGRGVTGAQLFVLRQIGATPGISVDALARRTFARQSTVSEVVARLTAAGFVTRARSAADARRVELALSAAGRRIVRRNDAGPTAQERLAAALERLGPRQRRALADSLEAWLVEAQLTGTPATMFFEQR
jgi:DNA-binding MarR family transcriptional regulator